MDSINQQRRRGLALYAGDTVWTVVLPVSVDVSIGWLSTDSHSLRTLRHRIFLDGDTVSVGLPPLARINFIDPHYMVQYPQPVRMVVAGMCTYGSDIMLFLAEESPKEEWRGAYNTPQNNIQDNRTFTITIGHAKRPDANLLPSCIDVSADHEN